MGFQTQLNTELPSGKQNMHLIGYIADSAHHSLYVRSSLISGENGAIDRRELMQLLLSNHPADTEILLYAVSNIGLQDADSQ